MTASNPLLESRGLPRFSAIRPEHVEPAVDAILADYRARIDALLASDAPRDFAHIVLPGEELELVGSWTSHPKFGKQFQFTECRSLLPSTVEGIKRYLGSGLVKGVGPKMAERIVERFGERTFDVLDEARRPVPALDGQAVR